LLEKKKKKKGRGKGGETKGGKTVCLRDYLSVEVVYYTDGDVNQWAGGEKEKKEGSQVALDVNRGSIGHPESLRNWGKRRKEEGKATFRAPLLV